MTGSHNNIITIDANRANADYFVTELKHATPMSYLRVHCPENFDYDVFSCIRALMWSENYTRMQGPGGRMIIIAHSCEFSMIACSNLREVTVFYMPRPFDILQSTIN